MARSMKQKNEERKKFSGKYRQKKGVENPNSHFHDLSQNLFFIQISLRKIKRKKNIEI